MLKPVHVNVRFVCTQHIPGTRFVCVRSVYDRYINIYYNPYSIALFVEVRRAIKERQVGVEAQYLSL